VFTLVAAAVIGGLVVLSLIGRKPKPLSAGPHHAAVSARTSREDCLKCHDPSLAESVKPMPESHPLVWRKQEVACTTCHGASGLATTALARHARTRPQSESSIDALTNSAGGQR
jgi:hypothetical protein